MPRAIVVVPCYNEARRLNVRAFHEFARRDGAELLFVNDGSRDETLELLEDLHACHPDRFSFLHLAQNGGKAEAVRQGVLLALRTGADYVGFWDADLATPLEDIAGFCRILDTRPQVQVVLGTRMRLLGHRVERRPLRAWLGRLCARLATLPLGVQIFDTQCGAKLFRATDEVAQAFSQRFLARWIFDVEIFARMRLAARAAGLNSLREMLYEYPLDTWHEVKGSAVKSQDFVKAGMEMLKIYWAYSGVVSRASQSGTLFGQSTPQAANETSIDKQRQAA